jgi:hypothetical protein
MAETEAEKALKQAAEAAVLAAIDLVKSRVGQEGEVNPSKKGLKEAMAIATDLVKQTITLAMGAIVFSATLLKLTEAGSYLKTPQFLFFSWFAWGLSLIVGLVAMGRVVTLTSEECYNPMDGGLMWLGIAQQLLLVLGVVFFAIYVIYG